MEKTKNVRNRLKVRFVNENRDYVSVQCEFIEVSESYEYFPALLLKTEEVL